MPRRAAPINPSPNQAAKDLNARILNISTVRELCVLIDDRVAVFDYIHVPTAFRQVLGLPLRGTPRGVVEQALEKLERRAVHICDSLGGRGLATILHALARHRRSPSNTHLLPALEGRLRAVAGQCDPQAISNTLWAYATLGERPGAGVVQALEARLRVVVGDCRSQAIANTLWALSLIHI